MCDAGTDGLQVATYKVMHQMYYMQHAFFSIGQTGKRFEIACVLISRQQSLNMNNSF